VKNENVKRLYIQKHGREFLSRPKLEPKEEEEAASLSDRFPTLL
jgi:hypothetical protein